MCACCLISPIFSFFFIFSPTRGRKFFSLNFSSQLITFPISLPPPPESLNGAAQMSHANKSAIIIHFTTRRFHSHLRILSVGWRASKRHNNKLANREWVGWRRLSRCSMEYELFYCRWRIYFWLRIIIRIRHSHNFQSLTLTCTPRRPQLNPDSKLHTIDDWLRDTTDPEELKWLTRYAAATAAAFQVVMDQVEGVIDE